MFFVSFISAALSQAKEMLLWEESGTICINEKTLSCLNSNLFLSHVRGRYAHYVFRQIIQSPTEDDSKKLSVLPVG